MATAGHEFVQVLALGIVAGIERHAPVIAQTQGRALTAETAEGGAFDWLRLRIEGIDFHHPAEAIGLVDVTAVGLLRVRRGVEARVGGFPGVVFTGAAAGQAIALVRHPRGVIGRVAVDKVVGPVFLAGEEGAPGRDAGGAVVQSAEHLQAARVAGGLHQRMGCQRAGQTHRREHADTAVVGRVHNPLPLTIGALAHFDHRNPVGSLFLAHLVERPRLALIDFAGRVQRRVDVLVVHHQQATLAFTGESEEVHAVVVIAGLLELGLPIVAGVRVPSGGARFHRVTPGEERHGAVTLGHQHTVKGRIDLHRHALEVQQRAGAGLAAGADTAGEEAQCRQGQTALEHVAPTRIEQLGQRRIGAGVDGDVVVGFQAGVELAVLVHHEVSMAVSGGPGVHPGYGPSPRPSPINRRGDGQGG